MYLAGYPTGFIVGERILLNSAEMRKLVIKPSSVMKMGRGFRIFLENIFESDQPDFFHSDKRVVSFLKHFSFEREVCVCVFMQTDKRSNGNKFART